MDAMAGFLVTHRPQLLLLHCAGHGRHPVCGATNSSPMLAAIIAHCNMLHPLAGLGTIGTSSLSASRRGIMQASAVRISWQVCQEPSVLSSGFGWQPAAASAARQGGRQWQWCACARAPQQNSACAQRLKQVSMCGCVHACPYVGTLTASPRSCSTTPA